MAITLSCYYLFNQLVSNHLLIFREHIDVNKVKMTNNHQKTQLLDFHATKGI